VKEGSIVDSRAIQHESNPAFDFDGEKQTETRLLHEMDALGIRLAELELIYGTMTAGNLRYRITGSLEQQITSRDRRWRGWIMLDGSNEIIPSTPNNLVRLELDDKRAGEFSVVGITFTSDGRREYWMKSEGGFG
jgi:hypothetical protein